MTETHPDLKLRVENLVVKYADHQVLSDIHFTIHPGEVAALIGPNGAGKTTLIKAISGIIPISNGHVYIDGSDIHDLHDQARSRLLSVIPQARNLPAAFTVGEVVAMGRTAYIGWLGKLSREDEIIVESAMEKTNLLELKDRRLGELSGGEQQRVLVARAICQQAKVMLLDEPTTHLDIQYQVSLLKFLHSLAHEDKLVVIMAIHDLNMAERYADQVIALANGKIKAIGKPDQVLTEIILSELFHVPMRSISFAGESGKFIVPNP